VHPIFLIPAVLLGILTGKALARNTVRGDVGDDTTLEPTSVDLKGVTFGAWEKFVGLMATAPKGTVTPRGKLGAFSMDARRLKDVGFMVSAGKGRRGDEAGVWLGKWTPPLTEAAFLGSMPLQYAAFVRSMRSAAPKVSRLVGSRVDEGTCSLSGLLGVSHVAGDTGVESWVKSPEIRRRFSSTTQAFQRTNGIF